MNPFQYLAATDRPAFKRARRHLLQENRKQSATLTKMPHVPKKTSEPHGVWRSRDFFVAAYLSGSGDLRLTVNRSDVGNDGNWKDGITWEELMECKRQAGYGNLWAVEVYPPDGEVVNVANMRHLWIVQKPPFAWSAGKEGA